MSDELQIMREIVQRLEPLDAAARSRVLGWLISVLEIQDPRSDGGGSAQKRNVGGASVSLSAGSSTFAELFHLAAPKTEKEKALVAAYWIQRTGNGECFASQQVNTELKHIGYGVTNITDALSQLIEDRPSAVIQIKKAGTSKQARKIYKVTDAGLKRVAALVEAGNGD